MRGFDHATILVPVSTVSTRNAWHNDPPFVYKIWRKTPGGYFQENSVGVCFTLLETLTLFQTKICDFCYPISDLIKNLVHYFRTEDLEPVAWPERETSCYGTYTVGVNIKREMVLSPNDEEIASSKKPTHFKTRVHKPYLISDQNGRNWYPISDQNGWKNHTFWHRTYLYSLYKGVPPPPWGRKRRCRLWVSLLTQVRLKRVQPQPHVLSKASILSPQLQLKKCGRCEVRNRNYFKKY